MASDQPFLMKELIVLGAFLDADGEAHVLDRHRIARRFDRN